MKLFLCSASPRRKEIMQMLPYEFEVFISHFDEKAFECGLSENIRHNVKEYNLLIAEQKALAAYKELAQIYPNEKILVLSADTIVALGDEIFGKGENRQKAIDMLMKLNGQTHHVYTSICLMGDDVFKSTCEISEVTFAKIDRELIEAYVDREKPFDKSGSYGIQEGAGLFMEKINGSFYNIMGLPLRGTYDLISEFDKDLQKKSGY